MTILLVEDDEVIAEFVAKGLRDFAEENRGSGIASSGVTGAGRREISAPALVRAIVEAHSGHVSVESAPGRGSRFTVRLPVAS